MDKFKYEVELIAKAENAAAFLEKVMKLTSSWIEIPRLVEGAPFDNAGHERHYTLVCAANPTVKYVSGWDIFQLGRASGCIPKECRQVFTEG